MFWTPAAARRTITSRPIRSTSCSQEPLAPAQNIFADRQSNTLMAICTDGSRCGSAIYCNSTLELIADRRDPSDPYKGLDLIIQRFAPGYLIVSAVQKKLLTFLEKRFSFKVIDMSKKSILTCDYHMASNLNSQIGSGIGHESTNSESSSSFQDCDANIQDIIRQFDTGSFTLIVAPNPWFCMSKGYRRLLHSEMVDSMSCQSMEERDFYVASKVKKSVDVCALRSIAAIGEYIEQAAVRKGQAQVNSVHGTQVSQNPNLDQHVSDEMETHDRIDTMIIIGVRYVDPGPVLSIDRLSLEALEIFKEEKKKKVQSDGNMPDQPVQIEYPSLYELLNLCKSPQGKVHLQTIMLWPLQDIDELRFRHDIVEFFMTPEGNILREQLVMQMKNVVPLASLIARLSNAVASHRDLAVIYRSIWSFVSMSEIIQTNNNSHGLELFSRISALNKDELSAILDSLVNMIDFEASKREKRVQLCPGVDQNVDEKKELVNNLPRFCDEVALEETSKYRDVFTKQFRVLYVPRIGFLASIDYMSMSELEKINSYPEFEMLLYTERSVYFKTKKMEELDENAGDIACDLIDVQEDILIKLQTEILKHSQSLLKLMELFGELDCLIAFSTVSQQNSYTRPEFIVNSDEMDIRQAYHPLHSLKFNIIPNDLKFFNATSQRMAKIMIITGPNSCGKTTYMKAVGLIIYMAHIGCFVPALNAKIPTVDAILTRLNSTNSVSTGLSTFASDLYQVNYALSRATHRSLMLIDEFGRGTLAQDGFALLVGLVTYLASKHHDSPYVMISTHFNHLIEHVQNYSEYILYKTFKVTKNIDGNVIYEYRIMDGVGETSLADRVAERAGLPNHIISRACEIRTSITEGEFIIPRAPRGA